MKGIDFVRKHIVNFHNLRGFATHDIERTIWHSTGKTIKQLYKAHIFCLKRIFARKKNKCMLLAE